MGVFGRNEVIAGGFLLSVLNNCIEAGMDSGLNPGGGGRNEGVIVLDVDVGSRIIVSGAAVEDSVIVDKADVGIVLDNIVSRTAVEAAVDGKTGGPAEWPRQHLCVPYAYKSVAHYHGFSAITLTIGAEVMLHHDLLPDQVIFRPPLGGNITLI